jgi:hypothetical protein
MANATIDCPHCGDSNPHLQAKDKGDEVAVAGAPSSQIGNAKTTRRNINGELFVGALVFMILQLPRAPAVLTRHPA